MKEVYRQPYTQNRAVEGWYGKPPKGHFKYDQIKLRIPCKEQKGEYFYMTPNEALDIIRALSAAVNHWLLNENGYKKILKALSK